MTAILKGLFTSGLSVLSGIQGYLIVGAVSSVLAFGAGYYTKSKFVQAAKVQVVTKIIKQIGFQNAITTAIETHFADQVSLDQAHTQFVILEIPQHVTPEIDAAYPVPCGFVRVFNDAWHGPVPEPAFCPDAAPASTPQSEVTDAEAVNGGSYDRIAHQLTALQDWIRQQQALSEKSK